MARIPILDRWRYDFDCRNCLQLQYVKDEIRDGMYCIPTKDGADPLHADDDRVVRCDRYEPRQIRMEEGQEHVHQEL